MKKQDWQLVPVANHDPRLILVMAERDPDTGELCIEKQPITGWLMVTNIETWQTSCDPITIVEYGNDQETIVFNEVTTEWYEPSLNQRIGKGWEDMMDYLQEQTKKGLRVVK